MLLDAREEDEEDEEEEEEEEGGGGGVVGLAMGVGSHLGEGEGERQPGTKQHRQQIGRAHV